MSTRDVDNRIRDLASRQHGLVSRRQLRAHSVSPGAIRRRIDNGFLQTVSPRVLRVAGSPVTDEAAMMAAVLDVGPDTFLSHRSLAALLGLPGFTVHPIEVTGDRPRVRDDEHPLAVVHRPRLLLPHHVTEIDRIPATTPSRMIFDLAGLPDIHPKRLERLLDTAWARNLVCHASMTRVAIDLCKRGRTGSTLSRELMADRPVDYMPPGSGAEARFQEIARGVGLWDFERQIHLGDGESWIGRVDFVDSKRGLVIEVDCAMYHGSITDRRSDELRQRRLEAAGMVVRRVDDTDLFHRRPMVEQLLRDLARRAA